MGNCFKFDKPLKNERPIKSKEFKKVTLQYNSGDNDLNEEIKDFNTLDESNTK